MVLLAAFRFKEGFHESGFFIEPLWPNIAYLLPMRYLAR